MSIVVKGDTNGVEPLLQVRELGYDNYAAVEVVVPQSITRLQAKLQLSHIGKFSQGETLI
jgi:hypothetical protein